MSTKVLDELDKDLELSDEHLDPTEPSGDISLNFIYEILVFQKIGPQHYFLI